MEITRRTILKLTAVVTGVVTGFHYRETPGVTGGGTSIGFEVSSYSSLSEVPQPVTSVMLIFIHGDEQKGIYTMTGEELPVRRTTDTFEVVVSKTLSGVPEPITPTQFIFLQDGSGVAIRGSPNLYESVNFDFTIGDDVDSVMFDDQLDVVFVPQDGVYTQ